MNANVETDSSQMPRTLSQEPRMEQLFPRSHLIRGERILWEGRPSLIAYILGPVFWMIFLVVAGGIGFLYMNGMIHSSSDIPTMACLIPLILVILFSAIYLVLAFLEWGHTFYAITNMRVLTQYGVLSTKLASVKFDKIQNSTVLQSFIEKIIGCGTILFATSGLMGGVDTKQASKMMVSGGAVVWRSIEQPMVIYRHAQEIADYSLKTQKMNEYRDMARIMSAQDANMGTIGKKNTTPEGHENIEEKLRKLKTLREKGLLTDEEYAAKKKNLIDKL